MVFTEVFEEVYVVTLLNSEDTDCTEYYVLNESQYDEFCEDEFMLSMTDFLHENSIDCVDSMQVLFDRCIEKNYIICDELRFFYD